MRFGWAELLTKSVVFRLKVLDHRLLVAVQPAGEHVEEKLTVEVHPRGNERRPGSGGKFWVVGPVACSAPMRPDFGSTEFLHQTAGCMMSLFEKNPSRPS